MSDTPSRVERVLNVLAFLIDAGRPLTREEVVAEVPGYPSQKTAYRRTFERDKEMLRGMGVPLEVDQRPDGQIGYRVRPESYYLPDPGLDDDETAALHVAVSAVGLGGPAGRGALLKIGGLGGDRVTPIASLPLAPALGALFEANRRRAVVTFTHRGRTRVVEPWALLSKWGNWYVVGFDRERSGIRAFRADRIDPRVVAGDQHAFEVPRDFSPEDHLRDEPWLFGDAADVQVRLLVDAGHVAGVVERLGEEVILERKASGQAVVEMSVADRSALRSYVLGFLEHAEVLEPPDLRAEIVSWLEDIVSRRPGGAGGDPRSESGPA